MSSQEFEVGDRVQLVSARDSTLDEESVAPIYDDLEFGECYDVEAVKDNGYILVNGAALYYSPSHFQLISKGEDTMQDVDDITVEVDDSKLSEAIQKKAFDNGWNYLSHTFGEEKIKVDDPVLIFKEQENHHEKVIKTGTKEIDYYGPNYPLYHLPQDWNKVVKFLEQESQPTPTLNGREAEINGTQVKVGCWEGTSSELKALKGHMEGVGITSGAVAVKGERVDVEELYQFIEDVKEVVGHDD